MWVNKFVWDSVCENYTAARSKNEVLERENTANHTTLDWLMLRVTQLEKERAVLLERVCGVVIETPVISRQPVSPIPQNVPVDALPIFDDMGDEQAAKLGIGWNEDGTVRHA